MPKLKSLVFGGSAFGGCSRVAFEGGCFDERMMNRLA